MSMRKIAFEEGAFAEFCQWATEDKKVFKKILELIRDIQRDSFSGIAKRMFEKSS
jgi:toxin YoeB